MTLAHQETLAYGVFTLFFTTLFVLTIRYQRRTGTRHGWFYPSIVAVVLGVVLMVITWNGTVLGGMGGGS
jgi:NADH:ubiquinone oxidoreductase subunit 2 (subunit N)